MLVKQRRVRRIKGAGLMDFFGSAASKIGSFIKSPAVQSIKTKIVDFANTDVGKTLVSAGKDVAIAGATGIKNKIVEAINNKTANTDSKQASKELTEYLARSLAMSGATANQGISDNKANMQAPIQTRDSGLRPGETSGAGVNVKKVNDLLKKVSGKGLSKLN